MFSQALVIRVDVMSGVASTFKIGLDYKLYDSESLISSNLMLISGQLNYRPLMVLIDKDVYVVN